MSIITETEIDAVALIEAKRRMKRSKRRVIGGPVEGVSESRQAPLYHYMDDRKAKSVFTSDVMHARWGHNIDGKHVMGNSFTRNKNYSHNRPVRLTVNQAVLAMRNKIVPLDGEQSFRNTMNIQDAEFFPDQPKRISNISDRKINSSVGKDKALQEEFVIGDIKPLSRAITKIEIVDPSGQPLMSGQNMIDLLELCQNYSKKHNIELSVHPEFLDRIERVKAHWALDESVNDSSIIESSKDILVYRGEYSGNRGGKFWTQDKEFARQFTQSGQDKEILMRYINSSVIKDCTDTYAGDPDAVDEQAAIAKKEGYKALLLNEGRGEPNSIWVFDKTALKMRMSEDTQLNESQATLYHGTGIIEILSIVSNNVIMASEDDNDMHAVFCSSDPLKAKKYSASFKGPKGGVISLNAGELVRDGYQINRYDYYEDVNGFEYVITDDIDNATKYISKISLYPSAVALLKNPRALYDFPEAKMIWEDEQDFLLAVSMLIRFMKGSNQIAEATLLNDGRQHGDVLYKNPTQKTLVQLSQKWGDLRGMLGDKGTVYIWPAMHNIHASEGLASTIRNYDDPEFQGSELSFYYFANKAVADKFRDVGGNKTYKGGEEWADVSDTHRLDIGNGELCLDDFKRLSAYSASPKMARLMVTTVSESSGGSVVTSGKQLMTKYKGKIMPYDKLPKTYQDSLTQWMVVEGENEDYTEDHYGVVEVPMNDILQIIYRQLGGGQTFEQFWGNGKAGYGRAYSERWPIIWSDLGWEDGMHRLTTYRSRGETSVPIVVVGLDDIVNENKPPLKLGNKMVTVDINPKVIKLGSKSSQSLDDFMDDYNGLTKPHPINTRARIIDDAATTVVKPFDRMGHIEDIVSLKQGGGREALNFLCNLADKHGVKLTLTAKRYDPSGKLDTSELKAWYERYGFQDDEDSYGSDSEGWDMTRWPR